MCRARYKIVRPGYLQKLITTYTKLGGETFENNGRIENIPAVNKKRVLDGRSSSQGDGKPADRIFLGTISLLSCLEPVFNCRMR